MNEILSFSFPIRTYALSFSRFQIWWTDSDQFLIMLSALILIFILYFDIELVQYYRITTM